jgi:hypothetical protein
MIAIVAATMTFKIAVVTYDGTIISCHLAIGDQVEYQESPVTNQLRHRKKDNVI